MQSSTPLPPTHHPINLLASNREQAKAWFEELRDLICASLEEIEQELASFLKENPTSDLARAYEKKLSKLSSNLVFEKSSWKRQDPLHEKVGDASPDLGGGTMALLKGLVFEKGGVNVSTVWGNFSPQFAPHIPGTQRDSRFWASGISLVIHPFSPLIPTVHMNTRYIMTEKDWFGGGADLTPMQWIANEDDKVAFHRAFQETCARHDPSYYPDFKKACDEYFYLPHRGESRGIGGIFYDYFNTGNWAKDFIFTKDVGRTFLKVYPEIVRAHLFDVWTDAQKQEQLQKRGRYVEFNLIYDRGTTFGLKTNGNTEAILMSMPPEVTWP